MFSRKKINNRILQDDDNASSIHNIMNLVPDAVEQELGIKIYYMTYKFTYSNQVSNSHSSPVNGTTNFLRHKDMPLYYQGFRGHVLMHICNSIDGITRYLSRHHPESINGLNFGSGGGSSIDGLINNTESFKLKSISYDCNIFLDDFPVLKKETNKILNLEKLRNSQSSSHNVSHSKQLVDLSGKYLREGYRVI